MTISLWCVLAAGLLPVLTTGVAKFIGGSYDNRDPRGRAMSYVGAARRAHAAHLNGFEAFPLFAAAVLIAELKGGPRGMVDLLAVGHVLFRLGYTAAYILDRPTLRSFLWSGALFCTIVVFISPLWR